MKLKATIISLVSIALVAVAVIAGYCFWPAIHGTITDNKYYSAEDVQTARDEAYAEGCKNEKEQLAQIKHYKELVTEYTAEIRAITAELEACQSQATVDATQIADLRSRLATATAQLGNAENRINDLIQSNNAYQEYFNSLENTENKFSATFYYEGSLYYSELVNPNETVSSLTNPVSTESEQFIGWMVNGVLVPDVSTYPITNNTVFVASITKYHKVTFLLKNAVYREIRVINYGTPSIENPSLDAKSRFNGWLLNGVKVTLSECSITEDTTFEASITELNQVTFKYNNQILDTWYVENGYYDLPEQVDIGESSPVKVSWALAGNPHTVNEKNYLINSDLTFVVAAIDRGHTTGGLDPYNPEELH